MDQLPVTKTSSQRPSPYKRSYEQSYEQSYERFYKHRKRDDS